MRARVSGDSTEITASDGPKHVKTARIGVAQRPECPLSPPKQPFEITDLDSVRMSAFGHKQTSFTCEQKLKRDEAGSWEEGNGDATLTGTLFDGTEFEGTDSICIVP